MGKFFDTQKFYGRNDAPAMLLNEFWNNGTLRIDASDVVEAWTGAEYPERCAEAVLWEELFSAVGVHDAGGNPITMEGPLTVWRAAHPEEHELEEFGMAWTTRRQQAEWFLNRWDNAQGRVLLRAEVPAGAVLADYRNGERWGERGEDEIVVNTPEWWINPEIVTVPESAKAAQVEAERGSHDFSA